MNIMQDGWIERDDLQITVLTDQVECKRHKNYGESVMKCQFFFKKTTSRKWSALHAVHSYNQWLEINNKCSQQTFIIGLNVMPDVLLQLPKHVMFFTLSLAFMHSQRKVVRSKEVRRSSWPGDVTKTWTEVYRKIDSQTIYWSTCSVCYGSFLVERSTPSTSESVSHISSIVRLQSLYISSLTCQGRALTI